MTNLNSTGEAVLTARGLTKDYVMGEVVVHALTSVDLDVAQGELVALVGPSGSGKSTLLNILGGLDTPKRGTASWRDHDLSRASESELTRYRRDHVGFVFQFYNLIPSLTVLENVSSRRFWTASERIPAWFCIRATPSATGGGSPPSRQASIDGGM